MQFTKKIKTVQAADLLASVDESIKKMMERISQKAKEQINNVLVSDRRRVHAYYSFLWVWHRLDDSRWKNSSIQMRTGRKRTSKLEVDHTVADTWWRNLVDQQIQSKQNNFVGNMDERALLAPDEFESRHDAIAFINMLGNCSLLDKSFNISKSDASMHDFLQQVHEFRDGKVQMKDWEAALALTSALTLPANVAFVDIKKAIEIRDALIRRELIDFLEGNRFRVD